MNHVCLGEYSFLMQTIWKKGSFQGTGKLSKLFRMVPRGLNWPAGYETPQNKILRGMRPRRPKSRGVWDPADQNPAGYETQQTKILWDMRPCTPKSCVVSDSAEQNPAWSHTPQNKVLRGMRPRRTIFEFEYLPKFKTEFENILGYESYGVDSWKKPEAENLVLLSL